QEPGLQAAKQSDGQGLENRGESLRTARIPGISARAFDLSADGASSERQHEPLASLARRASAGIILRDLPRACGRGWRTEHRLDYDFDAARLDSSQSVGHAPHSALQAEGAHRPSRWPALALGLQGPDSGRRGE